MAEHHHDKTKPFQIVGKRTPLLDARAKVTGEAVYTDDLKFPRMLVAKLLRSPRPHARIKAINLEKARVIPGVVAIVLGDEAPNKFGVLPISKDETALAVGKVKYVGDIVAGVAAETELQALSACHAIEVEWEDLPSHQRMEKCLEPNGEPVHPDRSKDGSNLFKGVDQDFGDVDKAFEEAAWSARGTFEFPGINHGFTEPHAVIAKFDGGRLTIWTPQQVPHYLHRSLSEVLEMPMHLINVIRPMVGGGFGGKSDPFPHEMVAALLARKTGRPVKLLFDREEVFLTNHGRHPGRNTLGIALDAEGRITALDSKALIEGGAWASFGVVTTYYNGVLSLGPYAIPNFRYSGRRVYSNKPPHGAMRGHGSVNARMALECLLDELAEQSGIDPCDLRLRNCLEPNSFTVNDFRVTSMGFPECVRRVREASGWDSKYHKMPYGRGIGLGCGMYISGSAKPIHRTRMPQSTVHLKIDMDGGVTIHSLAAEIGQGSDTMLAQCVAEVLGLPLEWMRVYSRTTDLAPID
ncbi:MAG TPA: molybdopterin cofactor-binding domain-containing protein, partial [bacterium]|nr:molybdopterin cofactor-binding domain-containing protein [bacterium]